MVSVHIEFVLHSQSIRFVRLDYEHVQSDRKSVNLLLDLPRDRDSWCGPKGAIWPVGMRMEL